MNGARSTFMRKGYWLTALAAIVLLAASPGTAQAQVTITGPTMNTVGEGETATYTVSVKGNIPENTTSPTDCYGEPYGRLHWTPRASRPRAPRMVMSGDLSAEEQNPRSVVFDLDANDTAAAVAFSAIGTITIQTLQDDDAENERWTYYFQ